jgi:acyl-CoA synthetase (AMP-forming)/AMP-acid ligase II
MTEPLHELLDTTAASVPGKTAVVSDERTVTYGELAEESRRVAAWLHARGVRRGDRVAMVLPNRVETVLTLDDYAREVGAGTAGPDNRPAGPPPFPGITTDPVCLIYTSGSTAMPKGVVSTHRNVRFAASAIQSRIGVRPDDVVGVFLPLSFDYGLYQVFLAFQVGATLALGSDRHVGPGLLRKLREWKVTGLPLVPSIATTICRLLRRSPDQELPPLRFITNTGAKLGKRTVDELLASFPDCEPFLMFGLTECKRVSIMSPADYTRKPDSVGQPLPDTECLIVGDDGQVLPPGEPGELVVRGPHVMSGYWNAPELTAKRYRPWGNGLERALFTGDRCSIDEEGFLYFLGRDDDIYKSRGYRVSALEIEDAAAGVAGVDEAAVVPPEEEGRGAVLFAAGSASPDGVMATLRERLEDYKVPDQVLVLEELPLNTNGKVDKKRLRELLEREAVAR